MVGVISRRGQTSKMGDFIGVAFINISIGLSISIARSDSLFFSDNLRSVRINQASRSIANNLETLREVSESTNPKNIEQRRKIAEIEINLQQTKEILDGGVSISEPEN